LALTEKEERKMAAAPSHRTSPRTLRKLAAGHVFYEFSQKPQGAWDSFSTRNLGLAVQRKMAKDFAGDIGKMRLACSSMLARSLSVELESWGPVELNAFHNFAFLFALAPEVTEWTRQEKQALVDIIRAKAASDETVYLRLLQRHPRLRETVLHLGSEPDSPASV
jgi:hypothetical protein